MLVGLEPLHDQYSGIVSKMGKKTKMIMSVDLREASTMLSNLKVKRVVLR